MRDNIKEDLGVAFRNPAVAEPPRGLHLEQREFLNAFRELSKTEQLEVLELHHQIGELSSKARDVLLASVEMDQRELGHVFRGGPPRG